jgi:hypothetical protein
LTGLAAWEVARNTGASDLSVVGASMSWSGSPNSAVNAIGAVVDQVKDGDHVGVTDGKQLTCRV